MVRGLATTGQPPLPYPLMKKPIIFLVDDDRQVLRAIRRDIRQQYGADYEIIGTTSAHEALDSLHDLRKENEVVALFLSDQRMPEMLGVEFLEKARPLFPHAKRVLLTAYSDIEAAIKAINDVQLDYYLTKPWDPPEEKIFPVISDLLEAWQAHFVPPFEGLRVIGYQWAPRSHQVKDYLSGNLFPYQWLDVETHEAAAELMDLHQIDRASLPALIFEDGTLLADPSLQAIATKLGMSPEAREKLYDVAIIGAGPAGLSAAVYGASEGLRTLLVERRAPGGQAGTSSRIENYLGFPSGLSGADLARRAITQATRFGAEFLAPARVARIRSQDQYKILEMEDGKEIAARSVVITTGVDYRKLEAEGIDAFTGAGVYYGAATTEAYACRNVDVYIVGGGNSAGQAAMYLANFARQVYIVIRREGLEATMSHYLIEQLAQTANISILPHTEVVAAHGQTHLERLTLQTEDGARREVPAGALFIFIGARPYTDWIELDILKNDKGYIATGRELMRYPGFARVWKLARDPYLLETCVPGIFAAGDVRAGAMNRVASAVGEGAMAISFVHKYLAES